MQTNPSFLVVFYSACVLFIQCVCVCVCVVTLKNQINMFSNEAMLTLQWTDREQARICATFLIFFSVSQTSGPTELLSMKPPTKADCYT